MAKVYLGGAFTQFTADQVVARQSEIEQCLEAHIQVLKPKHNKDYPPEIEAHLPAVLTERDFYLFQQADMIVLDLLDLQEISIGAMIEIGWASALRKPIIAIVEQENIYQSIVFAHLVTYKVTTRAEAIAVVNSVLG